MKFDFEITPEDIVKAGQLFDRPVTAAAAEAALSSMQEVIGRKLDTLKNEILMRGLDIARFKPTTE